MLMVLKSNYEKLVNRPKNIVSHSKYLDRAYRKLVNYYDNVLRQFGHFPIKAYGLTTHMHDDEQDELADEGGVTFSNSASERANAEYNTYAQVMNKKACAYWKKMARVTAPNTKNDKKHTLYVVEFNSYDGFDKFRQADKKDLMKIATALSKSAKAIYKPVDLNNYYVIFIKDINGLALLSNKSKANHLLFVSAYHDDLFEDRCVSLRASLTANHAFNFNVLFKKSQLPSVYRMVMNAKNVSHDQTFRKFYLNLLKASTQKATIIEHC